MAFASSMSKPDGDSDELQRLLQRLMRPQSSDSDTGAGNRGSENLTSRLLLQHGIGKEEPSDGSEETLSSSRRRAELNKERLSLPIYALKDKLIRMVQKNQVTVVVGATGSGKSTQITQYLVEAGISRRKIGCTQPRRVAAVALARRVALEFGTTVGDKVGYKIRFENCAGSDTIIKYMTDGVLVTEFCSDRSVEDYSVLILDEAHERSVHTDVVLGLLKLCLAKRPDLKVIVTSATLDSDKFSAYFNGAPVLNIPGRGFPVEINYASSVDEDYINASALKVIWIHETQPPGDVLVFLPGQEEIEMAWDRIHELWSYLSRRHTHLPELLILPFYASLPPDDLNAVSEPTPPGTRKVILATNIAETSLTINNVNYVVDSGYAKQKEYNPRTGIDTLIVKQISKAQAIQRAGRTGRTAPGTVYRLYSKSTFEFVMVETPVPEIQRVNIEGVILQLASLGIVDVLNFPFIDQPQNESVVGALEYLIELGAMRMKGGSIEMTMIGRKMAGFPLDPTLAKVLIKSADLGCAEEILTIVACLSTQNPNVFSRAKKRKAEAELKSAVFKHPAGDHLTFVNVYKAWLENHCRESWCRENFINWRVLEEAKEIRKQLRLLLEHQKLPIQSCGNDFTKIQHALSSGFFHKVAKKSTRGHSYQVYGGGTLEEVYIFPGSTLFKTAPAWVLYHEVVKTKKPYMRCLMKIDPAWLNLHSPSFFVKLAKVFPDLKYLC